MNPPLSPCFVCHGPATKLRSITQITAPPVTPADTVAICDDCGPALSSALFQCTLQDLQKFTARRTDLTTSLRAPNLKK